jgi:hypothetical protein
MAKPTASSSRRVTNNEVMQTALLSRQALIEKMMGGKAKDINKDCGYPAVITTSEYKALYDREGIAARVVDIYPTESWQEDPEVVESMDGDETEFEKAWDKLVESQNVYHYLALVDELSGIGRYGLLFMGLNDGKPLDQPVAGLDPTGKAPAANAEPAVLKELKYLRAVDESCVKIKALEKDTKNPRFGHPTMYTITFKGEEGQSDLVVDVHWHRCIHVADNRVNSEVFGRPRMQNVFNRLYDLRKLLGGSAEMFWKGGFPGLSFEVNPDQTDVEFDEASIGEQVRKYDRGLQRYLAIQGVSAKSLAVQVADPSKHIECALQSIAITIGCPTRIFLGSEQAQLASGQDIKSWNRRIKKRQQKYVSPFVIKPFVDRLLAMGILPALGEDGYKVMWPDLGAPSDEEKSKIGKERTDALVNYVSSGLAALIPPKEYLTLVLGYDEESADAIVEASADFSEIPGPGEVSEDPNASADREHDAEQRELDRQARGKEQAAKAKAKPKPAKKPVKNMRRAAMKKKASRPGRY